MPIVSFRRLAAVLPAALWIAACGLDNGGADDGAAVDGGPGVDATSMQDTSTPQADVQVPPDDDVGVPVDDGGVDDVNVPDTNVPDAPPPEACASPTESCSDGVDNDCNGLVDCADPACGAFACTPLAPAGWTIMEVAPTTRPDCDPNFQTPTNLVEGAGGPPHQCSCTCALTAQGSCVHGSFSVQTQNSTLTCGAFPPLQVDAADGNCAQIANGGVDSVVGAKVLITPVPYSAGTCASTVNKVVSPITVSARGRMCSMAAQSAGGCAAGNTCAPKPTAAFGLCVTKLGDQACPQGFPTRHLMGTGITDTRTCNTCSACGVTGSCANQTVTDFEDNNCDPTKGRALTFAADGQCDTNNETAPTKYHAYKYAADVADASCSAGTSAPSGSVTANGVTTICCP